MPLVATQRCPLCERDAARAEPIYAVGRAGVGVVRCQRCGLAFATAGASAEDLGADYSARAQRDADADADARAGQGERPGIRRKRARVALYDRLSRGRIGNPHAGSRALDIGCNTGLLLDALAELGYATEGIERSPAAAQARAAGHRIHQVDIEGAETLDRRFDLITLTHVLEHLRRPVAALEWIRRHLAPGGILVVEVPNFDDAARPLWGLSYRPLELGDHLSFFDRATLQQALDRAGLDTLELWSAPQAGSVLFPSALSALDRGLTPALGALRRLRGRGDARPPATTGDGTRIRGGGRLGRLTERVLDGLERLDPALESAFGADCPWGANLVALASAPRA
ncbi:MAG: class I SAM-dependent methyltransferase [Myxococcales bacterium]|nr:class I SAM-dependent methyltransferase [Myxococcales bacterium]